MAVAEAPNTPAPTAPAAPTELLAPAGDRDCLHAAVENGADAVYFGLRGHNARARAANFPLDELPEVIGLLHRRGVRGYVTLNTLVFPAEVDEVERIVARVAEAGADAIIVQDLGLARLARAVAPGLEVHASTQMSITSRAGVELARSLGCSRVILARELSVAEIGKVAEGSPLPVEVFVHGALCVAYSGQCLTSEALGGRSANRGECAQACRLPYEVICDGRVVDLGDARHLLSPHDLAAHDLVPALVALGVASLKIEGRLKSPEYVASVTRNYRKALDEALDGRRDGLSRAEVREMELAFSRGFGHGFLDGTDHKALVRGDVAKKRGVLLGRVESVRGGSVRLDLAAPVKGGDGVVFDGDEAAGVPEQGGRVYEVRRPPAARGRAEAAGPGGLDGGPALLAFGRRDIDPSRLRPGQRVWKTDDPELSRRLRATFEGAPRRTVPLDVVVRAIAGKPLEIRGRTATGRDALVVSDEVLPVAERHPATSESLREGLERLGGTIYHLRAMDAVIDGGPLVPKSLLNALRRNLVARLDDPVATPPPRATAAGPVAPRLRAGLRDIAAEDPPAPALSALCRTVAQAGAAASAGVKTVYLDFQDIKGYPEGIAAARAAAGDVAVWLATPRIEKPGEGPLFAHLARQGGDGLLVRNAGGLAFCAERGVPFVADFALNAANELSVGLLKERGARRVTASYDLSVEQLDALLAAVPPGWLEVVIHQHMPMFHMEHCVFCATLSPGRDRTTCGRPCDRHEVRLRDRVGMEHPLTADVGCRNTLFNAVAQTAAEFLPRLIARGARHLRIEFLADGPEAVRRTLELYRGAVAGRRDARTLWKELKATGRYGVTRGPLAVL